jgi:hypothetical protein
MKREILCCLFAFALLTPALAQQNPTTSAEPVLLCDSMCWPKGRGPNNATEQQWLFCSRIFRTDLEGGYWRDLFNNGDLAVGKVATIRSADVPPHAGAANCSKTHSDLHGDDQQVRVTGFAYQAKICGISHGPWIAGHLFAIHVCGVTNDGKTVNFFPLPP